MLMMSTAGTAGTVPSSEYIENVENGTGNFTRAASAAVVLKVSGVRDSFF